MISRPAPSAAAGRGSLPALRIPTSSPPFSSTFAHGTTPNRHNRGRRRRALNFLPRQTRTGSSRSQRPPEAACTSYQKPKSKFAPIALAAQTTPTHKSIPSLNTHINWILSASRYFAFRSKSAFILLIPSLSGTMAISETTLKDTVLMMIDEQNAQGGLLGRPLEAVVVDPASNWPPETTS